MTNSNALRAERRAGAPCAARACVVERRLGRYQERVAQPVRLLASRHSRLADLAVSFPALLFALAVPRHAFDPARTVARVIAGAPLAELSDDAQVPTWLRKLPPETFVRPLPILPDGATFRRQIANHLPRSPRLAPMWLEAVADATAIANEQLGVWIARELVSDTKGVKLNRLRLVCLWAWYSGQRGTFGNALAGKFWTPTMRFRTAVAAAELWRSRAELYLHLGEEQIADMWLQPGCVDAYEFVPLCSADDVAEEAAAMKNCLTSYGYNLAHNRSRLWSMRKSGQRIATVEVARRFRDPLPRIAHLAAANNKGCTVEQWWAARRWLYAHDLPEISLNEIPRGEAPFSRACWVSLWRPYWLAKHRIPDWLPLVPSREALNEL